MWLNAVLMILILSHPPLRKEKNAKAVRMVKGKDGKYTVVACLTQATQRETAPAVFATQIAHTTQTTPP